MILLATIVVVLAVPGLAFNANRQPWPYADRQDLDANRRPWPYVNRPDLDANRPWSYADHASGLRR